MDISAAVSSPSATTPAANAVPQRNSFSNDPFREGELSSQRIVQLLDEVEALLRCVRRPDLAEPVPQDRVLLTLLFTDIVDSTRCAERLGDEEWARLLERYRAIVRTQLAIHRGREIDTAGDGFFASFESPARAVRCAAVIRTALQAIDLEIRAGLHTGECELVGSKVVGVAVHVAARIAACARSGEIMVSSTVRDLVAGSGLQFKGGEWRTLKGLCDDWRLFSVSGDARRPPMQ